MSLRILVLGLLLSLFSTTLLAAELTKSTVKIGELEIDEKLTYIDKNNITHVYLSFEELDRMSDILAKKINQSFAGLVGIARGGLLPTLLLSHKLNYGLLIKTIHLTSYNRDKQQEGIKELVSVELDDEGKNFLFVDDLTDTGKTLKYIKAKHQKALCACLIAKPEGKDSVQFYAIEVPQDTWIVFAYEQSLEDFNKEKERTLLK